MATGNPPYNFYSTTPPPDLFSPSDDDEDERGGIIPTLPSIDTLEDTTTSNNNNNSFYNKRGTDLFSSDEPSSEPPSDEPVFSDDTPSDTPIFSPPPFPFPTSTTTSSTVKDTTPIIGIDLGTTFSCVAIWENDHPVVIANNSGNRTTPSWVTFQKDAISVGEAACSKASRFPYSSIYDAKRMIGHKLTDPNIQASLKLWPFTVTEFRGNCVIELKPSDTLSGQPRYLSPEEVSAHVLAKMKHTAEDYLGCQVTRAVVTVPAYFNDAQRQATIDAATIAGLKVERIINEPTSAALAYGVEKRAESNKPLTLLVYDLGGGTLDVTILVVDGVVFEVRSTSGDTHLGGQDFDNNMVKFFLPQVQEKCAQDISNNAKALNKLRDACRVLKHNLSHSEEAAIEVDALVNGEDFDSFLTRQQFVDLNRELFERCLVPVDKALADARLSSSDIDEVVLIGGSTRIVRIQELLAEKFPGKYLSKRINPDEAVAMGAAIQGANLSQGGIQEKDARLSGITLMDVTPMSLGIELANGKMSVLIERNMTIPYSHTRVYKNNESYQTEAIVEVFEGEEKIAKNNRLLGRFTLPGLPPRPRGEVHIPVAFSLDVNGVLEVSASVSGEEGSTKTLVIKKDKGLLTEDEIKRKAKELSNWEQKCRVRTLN